MVVEREFLMCVYGSVDKFYVVGSVRGEWDVEVVVSLRRVIIVVKDICFIDEVSIECWRIVFLCGGV